MTKRPTILVTRRLPEAVEARLRRDFEARLNPDDRDLGEEDILAGARGADGILTSAIDRMPASLIRRLPDSVKIIATFSVGFDHIDLEAARARGITVTNTPDVLTDATADLTILLLLAASRRAAEGERLVRERRWIGWRPTQLLGLGLQGKNLGIVGMGRIGLAVARRARAFGLSVHYHNRRRLPPEKEEGAVYHETLETLLPLCPFVTLHCPLTPETRHMINRATIELMPPEAVLVNTARGGLVDDEALIEALRSGRLFAAGLDVFEGEPNLHPGYLELDNVFLLPHLGSATRDARNAMGFRCLYNLDCFFAGRPVPDALT
ncbi:MAG: D-glycerate dehydrogenase [Geminicoccaceae bacterium]|nr:D-glycerate dehydrogenase [Geminicoccaceae bacterium]MCX7629059.1 D-glycerate dehydrogenase [Geminicoccaceae bacterium]MDW8123818.1 D-glycerate dehydrogenase [Geminicoccaceae bacterium]MDW8341584.1 D-glycerate dehydrogenase [Geminicoccaceae bacterium]